jgi:amino acid transporter
MTSSDSNDASQSPHLLRRLNLLQATALNMTNMIGIGPFITIPLLMSALGGPQAMIGWIVALLIAIPDGMVWSELGAAMPGSGGTYLYLREAFGRATFGRLLAFLFIWQFLISGPLEIASGYIGFVQYLGYLWKDMTKLETNLVILVTGILAIILLYRRITAIGLLTIALWVGTLITVVAVIITGAMHFDPKIAFSFPPHAFSFSLSFLMGLGTASRLGMYDYLGYYDICYIGDEVKDPGRVIPRSILISLLVVAIMYLGINFSIIGVIPWKEFVPTDKHPEVANSIVSIFMERIYGRGVAGIFTVLVLWTAFGSVFALLLGYSRIPYAAALDGNFFPIFGRVHPKKNFPHISLLTVGILSIACSFFPLGTVIDALVVIRILVQFIGQIVAVTLLRRNAPDMPRPFRMWLYPLSSLVALVGWLFLFCTADWHLIKEGLGIIGAGILVFLVWMWQSHQWPFAPPAEIGSNTPPPSLEG